MSDNVIKDSIRPDIAQLLGEMRAVQNRMDRLDSAETGIRGDRTVETSEIGDAPREDFGQLLAQAVNQVNAVQKESSSLANAYQEGDPNVTLAQVVIASEKAGVAFEAMTEIRNRLVNAYEDIMNMPI